tara:strand:+ start:385 stop:570 length:186 start_codon:yes stop_codon:yes gene_type:complete
MIPHIILIMQEKELSPIDWVDDLCVCEREKGSVKIFPSLESAVSYRDEHAIDGKVVELPVY